MQVDDPVAAGPFVQVIHILGYYRDLRHPLRQRSNRPVGCVRLATQQLLPPPLVPAPYPGGIGHEAFRRRQLLGVVIRPETGQGIAEGGNPAFRRRARAGEDEDMSGFIDEAAKGMGTGCHKVLQ